MRQLAIVLGLLVFLQLATLRAACAQQDTGTVTLQPQGNDVLLTGNEWLSLPEIRAEDGALLSFNALSMRHNGLLQVTGGESGPVIEPWLKINGQAMKWTSSNWRLHSYWIPEGQGSRDGIDTKIVYLAPAGFRAAIIALTVTNQRDSAVEVELGLKTRFGSMQRVTYLPVLLGGDRKVSPAPWVGPGEVYSWITDDTQFAFALIHPNLKGQIAASPTTLSPETLATELVHLDAHQAHTVTAVLSIGQEEFSAAHAARALNEHLQRDGFEALLNEQIQWCLARSRQTSQPEIDTLMNRNFLFTRLYAWGRTIDTEQLVGVTSRSPRYYVAAAYWDRDAMLWSFPGLLDSDREFARETLHHALTEQLRNTGTHSRFINGSVLEDGFQLDELTAPIIALGQYLTRTQDLLFVQEHLSAIELLGKRLEAHRNSSLNLYWSMQDAQDEYQKLPFITQDNALVYRALLNLADIYQRLHRPQLARGYTQAALSLKSAMYTYLPATPPGLNEPIWPAASNGLKPPNNQSAFTEIPPGSLLKLVSLGIDTESSPLFQNTYRYLHSSNYRYSHTGTPFGFPGSYRLPFTSSWVLADELSLSLAREHALHTLLTSHWDNGIITEGIDPSTASIDNQGRAFATAAGYVAHALCEHFCTGATPRAKIDNAGPSH
jgi:uncharacterized protein